MPEQVIGIFAKYWEGLIALLSIPLGYVFKRLAGHDKRIAEIETKISDEVKDLRLEVKDDLGKLDSKMDSIMHHLLGERKE